MFAALRRRDIESPNSFRSGRHGKVNQAYPVRAIEAAEFDSFYDVGYQAFNGGWPPEVGRDLELLTFEFDRSAAAFDGDLIVGTACAYTYQLSVPGGAAAAGGVSAVSVLPSHRRRGIMSALLRHELADIAGRGEALAILWASEPGIYGRFGFGCAAEQLTFTIRRGEATLVPAAFTDKRAAPDLTIADPAAQTGAMAAVYAGVAAGRPGLPARDDRWWQAAIADPEVSREGASPMRCLIAADSDGPRGYAMYSTRSKWDQGVPGGEIRIHELQATDQQAAAALWTDLLNRDLIGEAQAYIRPVDDPLLEMLADRRRARVQLADGLWVRLVDVPAALSQRRYARDVDLAIEVVDTLMPANAGRYRLRARAGEPATCEPTTAGAEVTATVQALGAGYLGGMRLGALAAAGQVAEERPGAVAELSAAMSWDPAPWCPFVF
jgi:predicted acetyltransferase